MATLEETVKMAAPDGPPQAPRRSPQKGICTRCGTSAPGVWMCGKCRSKVTVIARQTREALEPEYLEARRRQGRIYMRKVRAASSAVEKGLTFTHTAISLEK